MSMKKTAFSISESKTVKSIHCMNFCDKLKVPKSQQSKWHLIIWFGKVTKLAWLPKETLQYELHLEYHDQKLSTVTLHIKAYWQTNDIQKLLKRNPIIPIHILCKKVLQSLHNKYYIFCKNVLQILHNKYKPNQLF